MPAERARAVVEAGCDAALNCWARLDEMAETLAILEPAAPRSLERLDRAMATVSRADPRRMGTVAREAIALRDALIASTNA